MKVEENKMMGLIIYQNLVLKSIRILQMDYTIEDMLLANNYFQNCYLAFSLRMADSLMG